MRRRRAQRSYAELLERDLPAGHTWRKLQAADPVLPPRCWKLVTRRIGIRLVGIPCGLLAGHDGPCL